jgi:predicted methyltransferase
MEGATRSNCLVGIKLSITRLRAEFNAYREAEVETRRHMEREMERRLEILNNKTEWVDKEQAEMKRLYMSRVEYAVEHKAVEGRIKLLETIQDISAGRASRSNLLATVAIFISALAFILDVAFRLAPK